jgi:thiosulfate dehydrogenase [quinone] large subunit
MARRKQNPMAINAQFKPQQIQDPPLTSFLFGSTKMAFFWLAVRLWVGYEWFEAGMHKVTDPKWTQTGESL